MNTLEKKIESLNEQILYKEKNKNKELILIEMKKIGIEKLPYSYSSLKKFIDSETMSFHYNKHYKGYVDKLNQALSKKDYGDLELEQIIKSISRFNKTIRNNAGGAFNHALFWKMLSPKKQAPSGEVLEKIKKDFGSYNQFKKEFEKVAQERFGSGWAWLVLTNRNTLKIMSTPNQDNPLMNIIEQGGFPILGLDLWEHAYYLKYKNKRDEYIKNFWNCVNWKFVNELYNTRAKRKLNESMVLRKIISESVSQTCSKSEIDKIRFIFTVNRSVVNTFSYAIMDILADVFHDNHYERGEYAPGEMAGVYDLEGKGRSVINKLNTNYNCFCILLNDVNKVLKFENKPEINLIGKTPDEQVAETEKFVSVIRKYKDRIFNPNSSTFKNLMATLSAKHKQGEKLESYVVKVLKKKFGNKNVIKIGKLGQSEDMLGGVDCKIIVDSQKKTAQIKPYTHTKTIDDSIMIFNTGQVKLYKTDWMIFGSEGKKIIVFENKDVKIVDGNYVIPSSNLIYELD